MRNLLVVAILFLQAFVSVHAQEGEDIIDPNLFLVHQEASRRLLGCLLALLSVLPDQGKNEQHHCNGRRGKGSHDHGWRYKVGSV